MAVICVLLRTSWPTTYCHLSADDAEWTTVRARLSFSCSCSQLPGIEATPCTLPAYSGLSYVVFEGTHATFALNNGAGEWDNNNSNDYHIEQPGVYAIESGKIVSLGKESTILAPVTLLLAHTTFTTTYLHASLDGAAWTELPGHAMIPTPPHLTSHATQWMHALLEAARGEFVLHDGQGNWDNNHGANYHFDGANVYELTNGVLSVYTPPTPAVPTSTERPLKRKHATTSEEHVLAEWATPAKRTLLDTKAAAAAIPTITVAGSAVKEPLPQQAHDQDTAQYTVESPAEPVTAGQTETPDQQHTEAEPVIDFVDFVEQAPPAAAATSQDTDTVDAPPSLAHPTPNFVAAPTRTPSATVTVLPGHPPRRRSATVLSTTTVAANGAVTVSTVRCSKRLAGLPPAALNIIRNQGLTTKTARTRLTGRRAVYGGAEGAAVHAAHKENADAAAGSVAGTESQ